MTSKTFLVKCSKIIIIVFTSSLVFLAILFFVKSGGKNENLTNKPTITFYAELGEADALFHANRRLYDAIKEGRVEETKQLILQSGWTSQDIGRRQHDALRVASFYGQKEVLNYLATTIFADTSMVGRYQIWDYIFESAARGGQITLMEEALVRGADLSHCPLSGNPALTILDHSLFMAAGTWQEGSIRWLIARGANPNMLLIPNYTPNLTPLGQALDGGIVYDDGECRGNQFEAVRALVEGGAVVGVDIVQFAKQKLTYRATTPEVVKYLEGRQGP